jgi:hypothetical protein
MLFEIKHRFTGSVLFSLECGSLKLCVEAAIKSDADLSGADLSRAYLTPIRDDLWAVLAGAPREVEGLRKALIEGRVDGSTYSGECACLVGTIANLRNVSHNDLGVIKPNSNRPIERFFLNISRGDTPETNQASSLAVQWTDEFLFNMREAFSLGEARLNSP